MKIRKSNYFYESARIIFYLRWYDPNKYTFNDVIIIRKNCKAQRIPIKDSSSISAFNIYKNMDLDFITLNYTYTKFKEFHHEVALTIV